jgi:hypothetical protein
MLVLLGMGYMFASLNVYFSYAGRASGNPLMLSFEDIVVAFAGSGKGSVLESALTGRMSAMLPHDEWTSLVNWLHDGSAKAAYETGVRSIFDKRCVTCHNGSIPRLPNLSSYEALQKVAALDTGTSIGTLVRLSHIHLFGMTFIFFIVGFAFTHAYVRPVWLKCAVIAAPFGATALDVSSWYFIKLYHVFAWIQIGSGVTMAVCFVIMWLTTMYQMWFSKPPESILRRSSGDIPWLG